MPFSKFRLRLVDLINRLFDILKDNQNYIFHLDAQTIVLEDYLEIYPQNKELLEKYVSNGNIRVGPWYLQNDFYLTDGEATVRNLMVGTKLAEKFGKCGMVGYCPDHFGNVSQLPQILNNFGIDSIIFGRGFREYEVVDGTRREKRLPAEFNWACEDGSKCLAIHLKCWYNNAQRLPEDQTLAQLLLDINEKNFEGLNLSEYVLLMNGVDHLEAQADVLEIINLLRASGRDIEQLSFDDYVEKVKASVKDKELYTHVGALNKGHDYDMLKGCWSSRIYLKIENRKVEDLLLNKLEPLYSYLLSSGFTGVYPESEMAYLWKELMKTHPHDSICGCSRDEVHKHMEDKYDVISETGNELLRRGLSIISLHSPHYLRKDENYCVTVFNGTETLSTDVVYAELNFLQSEKISDFALIDDKGNQIEYEILSKEPALLDVFSPLNLPGVLDVDRVKISFNAENVPPFTAKTYAVVPNQKGTIVEVSGGKEDCIENEYYLIETKNNILKITDKRNGKEYSNPIFVQDGGDKGDSYVYRTCKESALKIYPSEVKVERVGYFNQSVELSFDYDCPTHYDFAEDKRASQTVTMNIKMSLSLKKGSKSIAIDYVIDNKAKDHRVRFALDSGVFGGRLITDSAFDCEERLPYESCDVTDSNTHNNSTFIGYSNSDDSFAVYTEGQHEVEKCDNLLLLSVLRSTGVINRDSTTFEIKCGSNWEAPENQCLRTVKGRIGVEFSAEQTPAKLYQKGKLFRCGLLCSGDSFDSKKYSGGRFAVQASELEKLYYVPDKHAGNLTSSEQEFAFDNEDIAVTCYKKAEKGGVLVRLVNLSKKEVVTNFTAKDKVYLTTMSEQTEQPLDGKSITLKFKPKQIISLRIAD